MPYSQVSRLASCSVDIKRVEIRVRSIRSLAVLTLLTHVPTGLSLAAPWTSDGLWLHDPFYPCDFISCTKSHTRGLWLTHSIRVTLYRVQSIGLLMALYRVQSNTFVVGSGWPILFVWFYIMYKVSHSWSMTNPLYPCDFISCTKSRTRCGL